MVLLLARAWAWDLEGWVWPDDALPVPITWSGEQGGLTHDELDGIVRAAAATWDEAEDCRLSLTVAEGETPPSTYPEEGVAVVFGDPGGVVGEGVVCVRTSEGVRPDPFVRNGVELNAAPAAIIFVGDAVPWATDAAIDAGGLAGEHFSLQGLLTNELGNVLGLADTCRYSDETCSPEEAEATMYWATEPGTTMRSSLAPDDVEGITALYGDRVGLAFLCATTADDRLTARCQATAPFPLDDPAPTWDFGDGTSAEGTDVTHTWPEPGDWEVSVCVDSEVCGTPRCVTHVFRLSLDPDPTAPEGGPDDTAGTPATGCGCAAPPLGLPAPGLVVVGTLVAGAYRRPRGARTPP